MPNLKITDLDAAATLSETDLIEVVTDPSGTPASKKAALSTLRKLMGWDVHITASTDQDVTNNSTVQDDSQLLFPVASGEVWDVELILLYAGNNTTGDFKLDFGLPTVTGTWSYLGDSTTADAIQVSTGIRMAGITSLAAQVSLGTDASLTPRVFRGRLLFRAGSTGNVQFRFANASASSGRTSRRCAGSILRAKKLA